jgi:hypothetical protein
MALPVLETPEYFTDLPSSGKRVKYRPFLVKEEKILLIAIQEDDPKTVFNAIINIVNNCTFNEIPNVEDLPTFDIEWLFLQIRIKSKGSDVELLFKCENEVDGKPCNGITRIPFDLEQVEFKGDVKANKKIILDDDKQIGIIFKYPTLNIASTIHTIMDDEDISKMYDTLYDYVDTIFQGDQVFEDFTAKEFSEWIETLNKSQFEKVESFFENIPRIESTIKIVCEHCKHKETVTLKGLSSFLVS